MPVSRSRTRDTTLYDLLEVSPDATQTQIAKAYRTAAMKYHPDRNPDAPPEKFKEISAAYDVLKDAQKKDIYDQYGLNGLKEGVGSSGATSLFDLFMGGPTRQSRNEGLPKGESKTLPLKVTLESLYNGETRAVSFTRRIVCHQCHGSGCKEGKKRVHCRACQGQGVRMGMTRMGPITFQQPVQCRDCDGEGEIIAHKDKCQACHGSKIVNEQKTLEVVILPGYANGKKIKFRGESDQLPGIEAGDVFVLLEQEKHPVFERMNEQDLFLKLKINLNESLTGFKKTIEHLDGRHVLLQHPPDQPIVPNSTKKIANQGMISMETHHTGDLIIEFEVEFPPLNFFNDPALLQKLESLLPSKPVLHVPSGITLDESSPMVAYQKQSPSHKHRSARESDDEEDDEYVDDEDEDDEAHSQVHACQTH